MTLRWIELAPRAGTSPLSEHPFDRWIACPKPPNYNSRLPRGALQRLPCMTAGARGSEFSSATTLTPPAACGEFCARRQTILTVVGA